MLSDLTASIEDYLETIYLISKTQPVTRVKDISAKLNVSMPSVNSAVKVLSKKKFVNFERYGYIQLTKKGEQAGSLIYKKHEIIKTFFTDILNLKSEIAEKDACKIEHYISVESIERLDSFTEYFKENLKKDNWNDIFEKYYKSK